MFGFVLGAVCLVGLGMMAKRRRRWYAHAYGYGGGPGCGYAGDYGGHHGHHGWHAHHGHHGGPGGFGGHGPWARGWQAPEGGSWAGSQRGGGFGERWWRGGLFAMMRRLQLTPDQQTVVREELEQLRTALGEHRPEWGATRRDVAQAIRGESFDATVMGELFGRHDERLTEVRKAVMEAIGKIHAVLDETQRQRLAELMERGAGTWHPFRGDMV